jgi:hypothetical protein
MNLRLFVALIALAFAPVAARAADDDNPYKNVKVGDFAIYKMSMKVAGQNIAGTITQTISAKTDKEATIKVTGSFNGTDIPEQKQTIDLTKPFDPTKLGNQPMATDVKVEKGKEGKEKIKAAGKEYDTTWTSYKVKGKANGLDIDSDMKVWLSKDLPGAMAKMEMTMTVAGMKVEMTMDLSETGNKK